MAERLRGHLAVRQRKRRLCEEPLCRHCLERGIIRVAIVPDHIIPLATGGTDDESNIQCLCEDCHSIKTVSEASNLAAANHPEWLGLSAIPLTIVSGPPASGKTTYVRERAKPDDVVIDLDSILLGISLSYQCWSGGLDRSLLNQAIRQRNTMLGKLKRKRGCEAWFIVSAPTMREREWWANKLGGKTVLLHPGVEECKRRALERGTPNAVSGVERWERASMMPWSPPQPKKVKKRIGSDGWPID